MTGVVTEKPDLGEDHRKENGWHELPPRVADGDEDGPSRSQHADGEKNSERVIDRAAPTPVRRLRIITEPQVIAIMAQRVASHASALDSGVTASQYRQLINAVLHTTF